MSETLRDLVVSLSLNSDNFTRNIKSINKQIQEAESAFRLASAGVENFETTTSGLSSKLSTLQRAFQLQQDAVGQYERALQQASDKLQECYTRQNDYAQRLADAKDKQQQLKTEVASAAQAYKHYRNTLGETDSATIAAKANLDAYKSEYRAAVQEVKKLEGQNIALKKSTQNAADAFSAAQTKLNGAKGAVKETAAEIDQCNRQPALTRTSWSSAGEAIQASQRSIASIGKQMKAAESSYRLAAAGVKNFDKSAAGLTAKLTLLQEKLGLQQKAVAEYEKALAAAKEQLQAAQQVNDPDKIREATDAVQDAETALNNARAAVKQTQADIVSCNKELKTAQSEWTKAGKSLESFGKSCDSISKNLNKAGKLLSTTLTTPIVALGAAAIKSSIDFESSFASVRKTVDATEAQFEQLAATSKKMSTQVAAGTDEINEVMASGGQLGVATEHLSDFTRVMIDLGNSCEDLNAGDAATTIAQFANIMGASQSQFSNIGSTLVDLGNNFATTEKPIMEMAHRMAGAGKQVGLTEAQVLGFAAALSSVGIEAQMGGSAFSKALIKMEVASATGGDALEDFGKVAGMTGQQFKALWDSDPAAAFQSFIVGLSKQDDEGESAIAVLDEIGIKEVRLRDTMLRAVNATDLFSRAQNMATSAWKKNTALSEEANKRYATTESKLKNLKNTALLFGQQIGDDLNPTIRSLIVGAEELLQKFLSMDESQRKQIIQFAAYAAAAGPVLLVLGKITKGVGSVSTAFGKFATSVGKEKWQSSTVKSILTNEKYKGDALLQKTFTVDFLSKKAKLNEGEVPQYYVEKSHPAIVSAEVFDLAQYEMKRRAKKGRHTSAASVFSDKLVCGECGAVYGSKVWHSTDAYRTMIWRCNEKYAVKGRPCPSPHLRDEEIQNAFVQAVNQVLEQKEEILTALQEALTTLTDTDALECEIERLQAEQDVVSQQMSRMIRENAEVAQNQAEYNARLQPLEEQYEALKGAMLRTKETISEKTGRRRKLEAWLENMES